MEKKVLKEKSGQIEEGMDVKLLNSVPSALQVSAGSGKGSPKEMWEKQEVRRKIEAESESAGPTEESRRGSGFKESLRFTEVGTSGENLGSRGYKLRQNEEELSSSGEKLVFRGGKRRSREEKLGISEEDLRAIGDKQGSSAEKLGSSRENM